MNLSLLAVPSQGGEYQLPSLPIFSYDTITPTKPTSLTLHKRTHLFPYHDHHQISSSLMIKVKSRIGRDVLDSLDKNEVHKEKSVDESAAITSNNNDNNNNSNDKVIIINGAVTLMKKTVLGFNGFHASVLDRVDELVGRKVSLQLVSSVDGDPANDMKGKLSKPEYLEDWVNTLSDAKSGELTFRITFEWNEDMGEPGAFIIRNEHHSEFYLKNVTLNGILNHDKVHFLCNSWVYPAYRYSKDRMFFSNKTYLPHETPTPLGSYRAEELETLRSGKGEGKLEEWDRVYDYAYYNDLGDPDSGPKYVRPILGGSEEYPYPRRGRTGRAPARTDPKFESRLSCLKSMDIYVPRDERFGHLKMGDFLYQSLKAVGHGLQAQLKALFNGTPTEFDTFEDALRLYEEGIKLPDEALLKEKSYLKMLKGLLHIDGPPVLKFPLPHIIKEDKSAWTSDEEFAREMLAGVNPVVIRRLEHFPPVSKLDPQKYGNHNSTITKDHIERNLDGLTVEEAIKNNKLFILDHHDTLMPYLRRINTTSTKTYATRTLLFLEDNGTLKPLAIELSLPHPNGDQLGAVSQVYTPAQEGVEGSIWQLAKAYVSVNDSGYHQLISHWLNTHAVIEPFVIATNRQLSVLHPIHKLLYPHFRDTMNINALARQILIGAEGIFERTVFPQKYALEMSSLLYKNWVFTDQSLPKDLMKRGIAVKDPQSPHGYRLLIQDYPYAVDGLDIWSAIESWVHDYCSFYYKTDEMIVNDIELQSWWKELKDKGHGDLKDSHWWPKMKSFQDLTETCTIIIWVASALHAAVNFGQYPYAGYLPNRPTTSRRLMPEPGTPEFEELESKPETAYLRTITSQFQTLLGISLIEVLSRHSSDEIYLGQRESPDQWTDDHGPLDAFQRFGKRLEEIECEINERNSNIMWRNRVGPINMPYTLLVPSSEGGLTAKGIPNSITI